jgi:hypothetical protein
MGRRRRQLATTKTQLREAMHYPLPKPLESAFTAIDNECRATRFLHPIPESQRQAFARIDRD